MAGGSGRRGGDRVLESRHLAGLFLGVVLLCGVFFTLGYVMGRTQYGASAVQAAATAEKTLGRAIAQEKPQPAAAPSPAPGNGEWDFYTKKDNNHLEPAQPESSSTAAPQPAPAPAPKTPVAVTKPTPAAARLGPPKMTKGGIVLQVAALTHQSDALAMADALQKKRFPSYVVAPSTDNFYRVQVGPYPDERAAQAAKSSLERSGFKAIVKR